MRTQSGSLSLIAASMLRACDLGPTLAALGLRLATMLASLRAMHCMHCSVLLTCLA